MSDPQKCSKVLRHVMLATGLLMTLAGTGCMTTTLLVIKHYNERQIDKSCSDMHSVERAMSERCGEYHPGRFAAADVNRAAPEECPLTLAAGEPRRWRMLPELVAKGARPEHCTVPPLAALLKKPAPQVESALRSASREQVDALVWIASTDPKAFHPAVVTWLSTPAARDAGMHRVLQAWADNGQLEPRKAGFVALAWLHPSALNTPLADQLVQRGQKPDVAVRSNPGAIEDALKAGDLAALDWWFDRVPGLPNLVADSRELRLDWRPLAYVATPGVIKDAKLRQRVARHLLARGADPTATLPQEPGVTVIAHAQRTSPDLVPMLKTAAASRNASSGAVAGRQVPAAAGAAVVAFPAR